MLAERVACCRCARERRTSPLTCLAICFLVLSYNLLGGFLFLALEGEVAAEETAVAASKPNLSRAQGAGDDLRSQTVERLWSITEDLNILYKENWTKLAAKELLDFQRVLLKSAGGGAAPGRADARHRWTFSSSFLYALTLITTIGHGNVTPKSSAGKLVAVAYACVGIPLIMLYLSTIGEALARNLRVLYSRACPARLRPRALHSSGANCGRLPRDAGDELEKPTRTPFEAALNLDSFGGGYHWTCRDHARVPLLLSVLVIVSYIALGTLAFHSTERWDLVDGCYFSFSSLATIGFGELRPGAGRAALAVCCTYILVGVAVVAMCFNLIREEAAALARGAAALCAGRARAVHSAEPRAARPAS